MKRNWKLTIGAIVAGAMMACGLIQPSTDSAVDVSTIVAATLSSALGGQPIQAASTIAPTAASGVQVSFSGVGFTIPAGLATGAACENVPAVDEQGGAPWDVAPAYVRCTLQGYPLQDKFFEPQLMFYPAPAYAAVSQGATNSMQRLQTIVGSPSPSLSNDALPALPWANAAQIIGAQPVVLPFNAGNGVRALAEYAQYSAPINNQELFYHFEGLSTDGQSYVVAVLPVNTAYLPATSDPNAPIPADGIPFPGLGNSDPAAWTAYYQTATNRLSTTTPESFQPSLAALDALIGSLSVSP